ncbi:MAG: hypothetical protein AAF404_03340 [Pseudomonadota bacterium]
MSGNNWRAIAWLVGGFAAALLCADLLMGTVYSAQPKRQARDGIQELSRTPNILAVSSSHGRSFHVLGQVLNEQTMGVSDLIAVPLEAGKVHAMEWLLHHRIKPLILDENQQIRKPLSHMMFGITWWDTCRVDEPVETAHNIVTHGWTVSDYARDVAAVGATELNRNYVRNLWRHLFGNSALVTTRFAVSENFSRFTNFLRVMVLGYLPENEYQQTLERWHNDIDHGHECFLSAMDMQAMDRFVEFTKQHQLDLTIVLFPLKPDTITETGLKDTIQPFARHMLAYGESNQVRVVDMTLGLLEDTDFMLDLDHVNAEGNVKWAEYALNNDFAFLRNMVTAGDTQ